LDVLGQIGIGFCLASLTYALTESSASGWTLEPLSAMACAVLFMVAFVVIERRVRHPMLPARLVKNKVLTTMALSGAVISMTFYGTVFDLSIYFQTI
jgi:DHA2 family methylenomycin A resistance protein-like MFS transporter